jgi:hypothetical protein
MFALFNNTEEAAIPAPPLPARYQREFEQAAGAFEN